MLQCNTFPDHRKLIGSYNFFYVSQTCSLRNSLQIQISRKNFDKLSWALVSELIQILTGENSIFHFLLISSLSNIQVFLPFLTRWTISENSPSFFFKNLIFHYLFINVDILTIDNICFLVFLIKDIVLNLGKLFLFNQVHWRLSY